MVSQHACIRVFKESSALIKAGYEVDLVAMQAPFAYNIYDTFSLFHDKEQLKRTIAASKADIFHVHNEPDWLVSAVREASDKPIIFDVHDLSSLRWGKVEPDEVQAFACADGFVHVSTPCREAAEKLHGAEKPTIILYPYVNEQFIAEPTEVAYSTVLYEGGLVSGVEQFPGMELDPVLAGIRNLIPVVKAFRDAGYQMHLYAAEETQGFAYENMGAVVYKTLVYPALTSAMRNYGLGFVGSATSVPLMEAAMPNKLFEYISQGIVPICYNASEAAKFVIEHGLGIVLDSLDNLSEQLAKAPRIRKNVLEARHELTMEKHIHILEGLYQSVL